jgi:lipooligosaccharide transport system permease protein
VILAIPAAVLTGMTFSSLIIAYAASQRSPDGFNAIFRFGVVPLFLLSGTFFPLEGLPAPLQAAAWISPLWHGSSLTRALASGAMVDDPLGAAVHLSILLATTAVGVRLAVRSFERYLSS